MTEIWTGVGWVEEEEEPTPKKQYHTDLDRDDFEPGELLPWQDMSRHLQNLEVFQQEHTERIQTLEHHVNQDWDQIAALHRKIDTLEKALQTTTDSLKQAHEKIAAMEVASNLEYKPVEEEVDPEQAAEMRSWERANTRFENLPEQGGEYPIYNRAYVDRMFRDGELEY